MVWVWMEVRLGGLGRWPGSRPWCVEERLGVEEEVEWVQCSLEALESPEVGAPV